MEKQKYENNIILPLAERTPQLRLPELMSKRVRRLSDFVFDKLAVKRPNLDAVRMKEKGYALPLGKTEKSLVCNREYTGTIRYDPSQEESARGYVYDEHVVEIPEAEAVMRTKRFLESYVDTVATSDDASEVATDLTVKAHHLLENMTYMTEQDLNQASEGLSNYWKGYLDEHPDNTVILISQQQKSSGYVARRALSFLDDVDRERIESSASLSFYDIQKRRNLAEDEGWLEQHMQHRKIVMVDDWVSTGRQISHEYGRVLGALPWHNDPAKQEAQRQLLIDHTEINLLVDSEKRITHGLVLNGDSMVDGIQLPIKAYWAKEGSDTITADLYGQPVEAGLLVTGSHSSTDDYFEEPCAQMVKVLQGEYGVSASMPPLANIQRPYRRR
jgi:hypothetical protein